MSRALVAIWILASGTSAFSAGTVLRVSTMLTAGTALAAGGCAKSTVAADSAAASRMAQAEFRQIEEEWELHGKVSRAELRPRLEEYLRDYASEPSAKRARLMLAQIALNERRLGSAEEIITPLLSGPEGPARDEAHVIMAALDNRRGHPERALDRLEPLHGKLLSREARDRYARERTSAALAARRWRLSVDAMVSWLAESGTNSRATQEWTAASLHQIPTRALSRMLADWGKKVALPSEQAASDWVHRLIIERLTDVALRTRNPLLARDLLQEAPPWLRAGQSGDELALLAALAQQEAKIAGRSVGVVIGGKSEAQKRRSVRVALGLMRGLGWGLAQGSPGGIKVLAVEERGSGEAALGTLSGLGASILIAGVDAESATEALVFAESRKVPVVIMDEPRTTEALSFGFILGVGVDAQKDAAKLSQGDSGKWAFIGEGNTLCSYSGRRPGTASIPLTTWQQEGVDSILVLGDAGCCRRISQELRVLGWAPHVVWGLEGAHARSAFGLEPVRLSTGEFPELSVDALSGEITEQERLMQEGKPPSRPQARDWYFSLGHDAAQLVRVALTSLPETQATDKEEVKKRHRHARGALLSARAHLITTRARGFSETSRIERQLLAVPSGGGESL